VETPKSAEMLEDSETIGLSLTLLGKKSIFNLTKPDIRSVIGKKELIPR
jgi:hypothetical protein